MYTESQAWHKWEHLSQDTVKMWPRNEDERGEPHSGFSGARTNKKCLSHSSEWMALLLPQQHEEWRLDSRQALGGRQGGERRQGWNLGHLSDPGHVA